MKRNVIFFSCFWFVLFLVFFFLLYFVVEYFEFLIGGRWCGFVWFVWDYEWVLVRSYIVFLIIFLYIVLFIVILWIYLVILGIIYCSNVFFRGNGEVEDKDCCFLRNKNVCFCWNKWVMKILILIVLVFVIMMLFLIVLCIIVVVWMEIEI